MVPTGVLHEMDLMNYELLRTCLNTSYGIQRQNERLTRIESDTEMILNMLYGLYEKAGLPPPTRTNTVQTDQPLETPNTAGEAETRLSMEQLKSKKQCAFHKNGSDCAKYRCELE